MSRKLIEIDGRTGEGGGQLVRVAIALVAVTNQPVRITNVRGNRPSSGGGRGRSSKTGEGSKKGGGLKAQHVTAVRWLAEATDAEVEGLSVGSSTLTFIPRLPPSAALDKDKYKSRKIKIVADTSAASTLLILQAVLHFLLFPKPIELEIQGGTNVDFSLSYEYLDQVLIPRLESSFEGVRVGRKLVKRGWSRGPQGKGSIPLRQISPPKNPYEGTPTDLRDVVHCIDVTMIAPSDAGALLQETLAKDIALAFPDAEINFKPFEDSCNEKRTYALLVARDASRTLSWGRGGYVSGPSYKHACHGKHRSADISYVVGEISRSVVSKLVDELSVSGSTVDKVLQDQLVIFQTLAEGTTSFPRAAAPKVGSGDDVDVASQDMAQLDLEERMRKDKTDKPFGYGSLHAQTARWVASEILPSVEWYNKGTICKGVGTSFS
ncbi:RNA 3'-terminal phosphate cyclase [Colletotrichum phormii]|uniref:RNA 3'-terminal phosphate cyclase n=1 Tax=Colletotrichum phormii TaxID=359342 RepID=A0AAJ0ELI4_9PEZI|nr:RNA 3'-terminal phosphate cyclase [Colletotrichum phormii]KAK1656371.1 RNA 3'-terminal phosphate cyclase [Colletotrichum phormii]